MNTSRSTLSTSEMSGYARMPFRRTTPSLTDVRACTSSRVHGPIADWWARHDNDRNGASTDAPTTCPDEGVASPADLQDGQQDNQDSVSVRADDEDSSPSLDYFAPAFRQVMGDAAPGASGMDTSREPASARSEAEEPAASLNYFTAALPSATAPERESGPTGGALFALDTAPAERADEASSPEDSLDYFAPALRRALGHAQHPDASSHGVQTDAPRAQEPVEHLKDAVKGRSEREEDEKPSESERQDPSHSRLDLSRLAGCLFTPSRGAFGLNGV